MVDVRRVPLAMWWLTLIGALVVGLVVHAVLVSRVDDAVRDLSFVEDWPSTTYVVDGRLESLEGVRETLPFLWEGVALYRVQVPPDADHGAGTTAQVEVQVGREGRRGPRLDEQPDVLQVRVRDDGSFGVVQTGRELEPAAAVVDRASDVVERAELTATTLERVGGGAAVATAAVLLVLTLRPGGRRRRFLGTPAALAQDPPDGPWSLPRWQQREQVLPGLERAALSPTLPSVLGLGTLALLPLAVIGGSFGVLAVLAGLVLASWCCGRERLVSSRRDAWARLGQESGMGLAPDAEDRHRARRPATVLRLTALVGVLLAAVVLLVAGLRAFAGTVAGVPGPSSGWATTAALLVVTAGSCAWAGLAQRRDVRRERSGALGRS